MLFNGPSTSKPVPRGHGIPNKQDKDQKAIIKMVTPVAQATEMTMSEVKREWDKLNQKKKEHSNLA